MKGMSEIRGTNSTLTYQYPLPFSDPYLNDKDLNEKSYIFYVSKEMSQRYQPNVFLAFKSLTRLDMFKISKKMVETA